jgi:hypothetical protein
LALARIGAPASALPEPAREGLRRAKLPADLADLSAERLVDEMQDALEGTKWNLWHGWPGRALERVADVEALMYNFDATYPKFGALEKLVYEFQRYIEEPNPLMIVNYGQRWREGLLISTAFVESLANSLLGKRFTKKQHMQWSHRGAHLLLNTCCSRRARRSSTASWPPRSANGTRRWRRRPTAGARLRSLPPVYMLS